MDAGIPHARLNSGALGRSAKKRSLAVNITPIERHGPIVFGAAAVAVAVVFLTGAASVIAVVPELLLFLAGLDLAVRGALGQFPLHRQFAFVSTPLRRPS